MRGTGVKTCALPIYSKDRAIYDADAMRETLVVRDDMTHEDAVDDFWYNIDGAYVGDDTQIYVFLNYER